MLPLQTVTNTEDDQVEECSSEKLCMSSYATGQHIKAILDGIRPTSTGTINIDLYILHFQIKPFSHQIIVIFFAVPSKRLCMASMT